MAAFDSFRAFNDTLSSEQRNRVKDFIASGMRELLAARSEDARKRILDNYLRDIHERLPGIQ